MLRDFICKWFGHKGLILYKEYYYADPQDQVQVVTKVCQRCKKTYHEYEFD